MLSTWACLKIRGTTKNIHHFHALLTRFPCKFQVQRKKSTIFTRLWHVFLVFGFLKDFFQGKWCSTIPSFFFFEGNHWKLVQDYKNHQELLSKQACWQKRLSSSPRPSKATRCFLTISGLLCITFICEGQAEACPYACTSGRSKNGFGRQTRITQETEFCPLPLMIMKNSPSKTSFLYRITVHFHLAKLEYLFHKIWIFDGFFKAFP